MVATSQNQALEQKKQFIRRTAEELRQDYKDKILNAETYVYYVLELKGAALWELRINVRGFCAEWEISERTFYWALSKLKVKKRISWRANDNKIVVKCEKKGNAHFSDLPNSQNVDSVKAPQDVAEAVQDIAEAVQDIAEAVQDVAEEIAESLTVAESHSATDYIQINIDTHTDSALPPHPTQESVCVIEVGIEAKEEIHQPLTSSHEGAVEKSSFADESQNLDRPSKPGISHVDKSSAPPLNKTSQKPKWACPGTEEDKREFLKFKGQLMVRDGLCSSVEGSTRALAWANANPEAADLLFENWLSAGKPSVTNLQQLNKTVEIPDFDTWDGDRHLAILDKYQRMSDDKFLAECSWYGNWIDWVKANKPEKLVKNSH